jgi:hypothetical protein
VTGRYSNQLNYHSKINDERWVMNDEQKTTQTRSALIIPNSSLLLLVGADGIEPPTFAL